jgi:hypothetical protein
MKRKWKTTTAKRHVEDFANMSLVKLKNRFSSLQEAIKRYENLKAEYESNLSKKILMIALWRQYGASMVPQMHASKWGL